MDQIIISFTSFPKRIKTVHRVVESLFMQTVPADKIILYLSADEFLNREKDIPKPLRMLAGNNGFQIEWVEGNLKSHKKYFYALQEYNMDTVITVDDDMIYAGTLIGDLLSLHKRFPDAVVARRVRLLLRNGERLAPYMEWDGLVKEYEGDRRAELCAIGTGGVLYPPRVSSAGWFEPEKIRRLAEDQDDLWLKCNEVIDGKPVVYAVPTQEDLPIESSQDIRLCDRNLTAGGNDVQIEKLVSYLKQYHPKVYEGWMDRIPQQEEYIKKKKEYYRRYCKKIFEEAGDLPVYLYGAGKRAGTILKILSDFHMEDAIDMVVVSEKRNNPEMLGGKRVRPLSELSKDSPAIVICGVAAEKKAEIVDRLRGHNCRILDPDLQGILKYYK